MCNTLVTVGSEKVMSHKIATLLGPFLFSRDLFFIVDVLSFTIKTAGKELVCSHSPHSHTSYGERERERERDTHTNTHTHTQVQRNDLLDVTRQRHDRPSKLRDTSGVASGSEQET
jgi:hypothetical protein